MPGSTPQGPSLGPLLAACAVGVLVTASFGALVQLPRGLLAVTLLVSLVAAGWLLLAPDPSQSS